LIFKNNKWLNRTNEYVATATNKEIIKDKLGLTFSSKIAKVKKVTEIQIKALQTNASKIKAIFSKVMTSRLPFFDQNFCKVMLLNARNLLITKKFVNG
jgi:hypothetical protein